MLDTRSAEEAMADTGVIASILAGNTALYRVFVHRYNRLPRSTAGRIFHGAEGVPGVLQGTHFRAFTHPADFKGLSSFSSWLTRITVFVLKEVEELSVAEIAGRLGIISSTIRSRVHRARKMLRVRLRSWEPRPGGFKWN